MSENQSGYIFVLDEQDGNAAFALRMTSTRDSLFIFKGAGAAGTNGAWTVPLIEETWNAVCIRLNFGADNAPTALVNFVAVTPNTQSIPSSIQDLPAMGYCVGNRSAQDRTWNGSIAHLHAFNSILSDANAMTALRNPGSYTTGLRLYLPMRNSSDVSDLSGNAFHGTGTDLVNANSVTRLLSTAMRPR